MYQLLSLLLPLALAPLATAQLNQLAKAAGLKYFGTTVDNIGTTQFNDPAWVALASNTSQWGQITPGNAQKWQFVEPQQGQFDFSYGDQLIAFAQKNNQIVRCHNLVWYSQLASYVTTTKWTNATLIAAMKEHITGVMNHYKGQCYAWDVVNEAFEDNGTYRNDVFYSTIGPEYIPIAFETAAAVDPSVKLYYNDYNTEFPGPKSDAAQALVKSLKARGIKIDGVGFESHFIVGEAPSKEAQVSNMQAYIALGVEVAVTELDVRFTSLPYDDAGLAQQSTDFVNSVEACLATMPGCVGVTTWEFDDKYSWIPAAFPGQGGADVFNASLVAKPAYYGVQSALAAAATAPSSSGGYAAAGAAAAAAGEEAAAGGAAAAGGFRRRRRSNV